MNPAARPQADVRDGLRAGSVLAARAGGAALLAFLALPVLALFVTSGPRALIAGLADPAVAPALLLSIRTTTAAILIVVALGTPLAYFLAHSDTRLAALAGSVVRLPIVIPPAVAGIALLRAFGRRGLLGGLLGAAGAHLAFTQAAVVLAQIFVSAPLFVEAAAAAFAAVDPRLPAVARTLGASPARVLFGIALPLARRGLLAGAALAWARALGEFGATLMFAGNMPGRTQTLPLAIYTALESDLAAAQALSVVLVLVAFVLLAALRGGPRFMFGGPRTRS